jgi:hypothetical protein
LDYEAAELAIMEFQGLLTASGGVYGSLGRDRVYSSLEWRNVEMKINESLPLVERIVVELDPRLASPMRAKPSMGWPHFPKIAALEEALGILRSKEKADAIFAPKGPQLAATDLHPWIWNAAVDLWADGHHREAVQRAATALFDSHLPAKLLSVGKPGDLVSQAFSLEPPEQGKNRLRIPGYAEGSESWKNVHNGARFIGMGCVAAIRNLSTHELELSEQEALEQLATLSVMARWVAESELATV